MIGKSPDCMDCKHFDKDNLSENVCKAFPERIPSKIIMGEIKHDKPLPEQKNKIVYEQK